MSADHTMPRRSSPLHPTGALDAIGDAVQAGIVAMDPAGRVVHVNAIFWAKVGYLVEELRGQTRLLLCWSAEHAGESMAGLQAALEGRFPPAGIETTFVSKYGKPFQVHGCTCSVCRSRHQ